MTENIRPTKSKDFLTLAKSGIILLVLFTATCGYLSGHSLEKPWNWGHFFLVLISITLLSSGSAALNQIQEVEIDRKMNRTKDRPLPSNRLTLRSAIFFSLGLITSGLVGLYFINTVVLILGIAALVSYNVLYTMWWKKHMAFGAVPGAIPGALPILMGYQAAAENLLDPKGLYLFAVLFMWQMPHFWVLALKYSDDYKDGGFPILPVAKGVDVTRNHIVLWSLAYVCLPLMAVLFFPIGVVSVLLMVLIGVWILVELYRYIQKSEAKTWLRFFLAVNFSLMMILGLIVIDLWSIYLLPKT